MRGRMMMRSEYGDDSEHLDPPSGDVLLDDLDVRVDPADRDAARQVDLRLRPDWDLDEDKDEAVTLMGILHIGIINDRKN